MSNTCVDSELTVAPQHETLMHLGAFFFFFLFSVYLEV